MSVERKLAAIVSTDVVGYSRLMGADEAGTLAVMRAHRKELWNPTIEKFGGRVVGTAGDSLLVEFASAVAAVESSITVQRGMVERNADLPDGNRMLLRIGINIGEVIIDGDDIFGDGVNVAARLQEIAAPGGIAVSGNFHEQIEGKIEDTFADDGLHEVKNIARPVPVWRWSAGEAEVAPVAPQAKLELPDKPSIAVLPFDNMSGDAEQEYFADGMTEDIITGLSKYRSFFVIARNTSFTFKGQSVDVKEAARKLGVRYVLEGSVRKAAQRIRITVQLIEGESGNHVWAERYDRQLEDIFDVQDEVTETIVGKLGHEIGSVERKRAAGRQPENLDAWGLMQQGLNHMWRMDADGLANAVRFLRAALDKAPGLAQAHSYLSFALEQQTHLGLEDANAELVAEAYDHARTAIELDEGDSLSHAVLARLLASEGRHDDAIHEAKIAIDLNPNHAMAHFTLAAVYAWANRHAEGQDAIDQAIRLSPNDPLMSLILGVRAMIVEKTDGNFEAALECVRSATRMPNADYRVWLILAAFSAAAGLMDEAQNAAAKVLQLRPDFSAKLFREKLYAGFHADVADELAERLILAGLPTE